MCFPASQYTIYQVSSHYNRNSDRDVVDGKDDTVQQDLLTSAIGELMVHSQFTTGQPDCENLQHAMLQHSDITRNGHSGESPIRKS